MTGRIIRWIIGLVILASIFLLLTVFIVRQGEMAVVERFGKVQRTIADPGLYFKWFFERAHHFDGRKRVLSPNGKETYTRNQQNIIVWSYVVWSVDVDLEPKSDPAAETARRKRNEEQIGQFLRSFQLTKVGPAQAYIEAEINLNNTVLDAQDRVLGGFDMDALVSMQPQVRRIDAIGAQIMREATAEAAKYGMRIQQFGFKRLAFPENNLVQAILRMRAKRTTEANRYFGEGVKAAGAIRTRTVSDVAMIKSAAERQAAETRGRGQADAARILMDAYREAPDFYRWIRSLDALKKVFSDKTTIVIDTSHPILSALETPVLVDPAVAGPGASTRPVARPAGANP